MYVAIDIQATKCYYTPETMFVIAFHSYLSVECSCMVFKVYMLIFKLKRFFPSLTLYLESSDSTAYTSYSMCDRNKLFVVLKY